VKTPQLYNPLTALMGLIMVILVGCQASQSAIRPKIVTPSNQIAGLTWWTPEPGQSWQVQYEGKIDLNRQVDIYNLDLFDTTVDDIQGLHDRGIRVICYLNAGAWENWRPDNQDFPQALLGNDYAGWSGERWLDIRKIEQLAPLMTARLDLCVEKGCDGVEPDNVDSYLQPTGFNLTAADQLKYNRWLAGEAHQRGLGVGLKNDPEQAVDLVNDFDWITTESCFHQGWCESVQPFIQASKPVFAIEYTHETAHLTHFCVTDLGQLIQPILKHRSLDAWLETCSSNR